MVVVCLQEVSTAALRSHNLAGVLVTPCLDVALKTSLTWPGPTSAVKSGHEILGHRGAGQHYLRADLRARASVFEVDPEGDAVAERGDGRQHFGGAKNKVALAEQAHTL